MIPPQEKPGPALISGGKMLPYRVGFTGTRKGLTQLQHKSLSENLKHLSLESVFRAELAHGDCIGADKEAHSIAREYGYWIEVHPPKIQAKRAFCDADKLFSPEDYLVRNKHIVDWCDILVACPESYVRLTRSGTWSTIRYASTKDVHALIVYPDGCVNEY